MVTICEHNAGARFTIKWLKTCALIFFFPLALLADTSIQLKVVPSSGTTEDIFSLSVTIDGNSSVPRPEVLENNDFAISYLGPQSSVAIMNGTVSQKLSYFFRLTPKHAGDLQTPGVRLEVDGQVVEKDPIRVRVIAPSEQKPQGRNANYWMEQRLSSRAFAYVGEQVVNTLEIVTRVPLLEPVLSDLTFSDFRNESFGETGNVRRYINGQPYTVNVIRKALFPLKPGNFVIPARKMQAKIRERKSNPSRGYPFGGFDPFDFDTNVFDDFFGTSSIRDIELSTEALSLEVRPLPPVPANLGGLKLPVLPVGATSLSLSYDSNPIKFGESKTVTVTIRSEGDLQGVKSLGLEHKNAKIYEEAPQSKNEEFGEKLLTTRSIALSVVPLVGGKFVMPDIGIRYFDPERGAYAVAHAPSVAFEVLGGPVAPIIRAPENADSTSSVAQVVPKSDEELYQEETTLERLSRQMSLSLALALLAGALLIVAGILGAMWVLRRKNRSRALVAPLKSAQNLEQLDTALRTYLARKLNLTSSEGLVFRGDLRRVITESDLLFTLESLLDRIEAGRFGGRMEPLLDLKSESLRLIRAI